MRRQTLRAEHHWAFNHFMHMFISCANEIVPYKKEWHCAPELCLYKGLACYEAVLDLQCIPWQPTHNLPRQTLCFLSLLKLQIKQSEKGDDSVEKCRCIALVWFQNKQFTHTPFACFSFTCLAFLLSSASFSKAFIKFSTKHYRH